MGLDEYKVVLYRSGPSGWVAEVPSIPGCYALMSTRAEALSELEQVFAMMESEYRDDPTGAIGGRFHEHESVILAATARERFCASKLVGDEQCHRLALLIDHVLESMPKILVLP